MTRVFIDTNVIIMFPFLDHPDAFIPEGEERVRFVITSSVLRELERIKDEHFSKGLRTRATRAISLLDCEQSQEAIELTQRSYLAYRYGEPDSSARQYLGATGNVPYEMFIATIKEIMGHSKCPFYVMSDDVGVRVRAKHIRGVKRILRPPGDRYALEEYNLPQVVKAIIKELAKEIAVEMREPAE